ncbi:MAG: hypothetical protein KGJ23_14455 [Euryarchaeota archaeon]|nr:hypothetical protein [Euryarchaeota archaeon]MDE2046185.1 hypothetical protein [Thermoplasmata archaeon]
MAVLTAAAVALPGWARGNVVVEGPDEDAFTLLVRAGELLRKTQPSNARARAEVRKVRVISSLAGDERSALFDAWGLPSVELVAYPDSTQGVVQSLSEALDEEVGEHDGPSWLLSAQLASPRGTGVDDPPKQSAAAAALAFGHGALAEGQGPNAPSPRTWVTGEGSTPAGPVRPPELRGFRGAASAPVSILLTLVAAAASSEGGTTGSWVHATGERTHQRTFLDGSKVPLQGYPVPEERVWFQVPEEAWRARAGAPLAAVSQGAYLSRETYLSTLPARWRLEGERCAQCSAFSLPPVGRCHRCGTRDSLRRGRLPHRGKVESATVIHPGAQPTEFDWHQETYGRYGVALVRFPDGDLLTFQLTDQQPAVSALGADVELELRRLYPQEGSWRYGLKAVVLPPASEAKATPHPRGA